MGTLIWTDTFESYTAGSAITAPWATVSNSPVVTAQAHGGTKSVAAGTGGNSSACTRPLGSNVPQWYADFWMWTNSVGNVYFGQYLSFSNSSSSPSTANIGIGVGSDGTGQAGWPGGTTWLSFTVSVGAWHHYLFEVTCAVAGTAKLTIDGTVIGTFSGDTRAGDGNSYVSNVWIVGSTIGPSPPAEYYVDDLSLYSGTPVVAGAAQARVMVLA